MTALTLAKRGSKLEVVSALEAAATERRRSNESERRGVWSGRRGQEA